MSNIFDWSQSLLGVQNPEEEMARYADRQQAQNRAALGLDANGNPLPPDPNNPNAAQAANTLPPGQVPNAVKSDPSMGRMIVDLQRYNERKQTFDSSLGGMFAAISQPRDRPMMEHAFDVNLPDPTKLGETIMNVGSQQQGQDTHNQLLAIANLPTNDPNNALGQLARANNMDPATAAFMIKQDPAKFAALSQANATATPQMANLQQIDRYVAGAQQRGVPPPVLAMIRNAMMANMAGPEAEAAVNDAMAYKNRTGKDAPWVVNGQIDQGQYKQFQVMQAQKNQDRVDAGRVLAENENTANELRGNLETLRDAPGLKSILNDSIKRAAAQKALQDPTINLQTFVANNTLTNEEAAVVATLRRIGGQSTATALHSLVGTGTRVTQQEVGPLKDSISTTQNLNQDYETYVRNAINPFITKIKKTVANSYGASGNLTHMDPELEPWLHSTYRKGGNLEATGAADIPDLQDPTTRPDLIASAKTHLINVPADKEDVLDYLQQQGLDVTKLRKTDPSKW